MSPDAQETAYRQEWMKAYQQALNEQGKKPPTSGQGEVGSPTQECESCKNKGDLLIVTWDARRNKPLEGVTVQISGPESKSGTTDAKGEVTFRALTPSPPPYKVIGTKEGYVSEGRMPEAKRTATVVANGSTQEQLRFQKLFLLADADQWFDTEVIPKRTAWSGGSPNRIWKSPRDWVTGNQSDPNGLCGDTSSYVDDQMWNDFQTKVTDDGYELVVILWDGKVLNHIANVMAVKGKTAVQEYKMTNGVLTLVSGTQQYTQADLFGLHVYDLYYKKRTTVGAWWKDQDGDYGGTLKLAPISEME
jgi:hypothetical protein